MSWNEASSRGGHRVLVVGGRSELQEPLLRRLSAAASLCVFLWLCDVSASTEDASREQTPTAEAASREGQFWIPPPAPKTALLFSGQKAAETSLTAAVGRGEGEGEGKAGGFDPCARGSVPFETYVLLVVLVLAFSAVATNALLQSGASTIPASNGGSPCGSSEDGRDSSCDEQERSALRPSRGGTRFAFALATRRCWLGWRTEAPEEESEGLGDAEGEDSTGPPTSPRRRGGAALRSRVLLLVALSAFLRAALLSVMLSLLMLPLLNPATATRGAGGRVDSSSPSTSKAKNDGLWPSPWQCTSVDVWTRVLLRFVPSLVLLLAFLLLVCFLIRLHAAAALQRSSFPSALTRGVGAGGAIAFALAAALTYRRSTQHLFQRWDHAEGISRRERACEERPRARETEAWWVLLRSFLRFACVLVGGMFAGTGLLWGVYGFLVIQDLKRRDLSLHRPLLSLHEGGEAAAALQGSAAAASPAFAGASASFENQGLRGGLIEAALSRSGPAARRGRSDEAQVRLFVLVCFCPLLLVLPGIYLLLVGASGRHLYPRAVQRAHQQITFDLLLLLAAELLPALLVVLAFTSANIQKQESPQQPQHSQQQDSSQGSNKQQDASECCCTSQAPEAARSSFLFRFLPESALSAAVDVQGGAFSGLPRQLNEAGGGGGALFTANSTGEFSRESEGEASM